MAKIKDRRKNLKNDTQDFFDDDFEVIYEDDLDDLLKNSFIEDNNERMIITMMMNLMTTMTTILTIMMKMTTTTDATIPSRPSKRILTGPRKSTVFQMSYHRLPKQPRPVLD